MPSKIRPEDWTPIGVRSLEDAARNAVRSKTNTVVIAGPGAGKTELLAQRACFLLQTGLCRRPHRILAISFKRDAARNLQDRVIKRCGAELGRRFESLTFDAFAKGLLDRFRLALPGPWRPTGDYEIEFNLTESKAQQWLQEIPEKQSGLSTGDIATMNVEKMFREEFVGSPLPEEPLKPTTVRQRAAGALWEYLLHHGDRCLVNFQMIGRMAELILRVNPKTVRALRATYSHVFLDEFQDTTGIQYDLTKTAFLGSETVLTAVGDNKQKIMGWAGALDDVFGRFQNDFSTGAPLRLVNNYRSAPEIVRVLGFLTAALDDKAVAPVAVDDGRNGSGECHVLIFADHEVESARLAEMVESWITSEGLAHRDICILTRVRPGDYTETIRAALQERGIEARIESELQDLLSEPLVTYLLNTLNVAVREQAPEARSALLDLLVEFEGGDAEAVGRRVEKALCSLIGRVRRRIQELSKSADDVQQIVSMIIEFLDRERLASAFPQYSQGDLFEKTVSGFVKNVSAYLQTLEWPEALDALVGTGSIPIMTLHKSKGLEYHTVVFVGLEDSALWSFAKSQDEETRGFFVAFSRAKKRVIFTFSGARPRYPGRRAEPQQRRAIDRLYELLASAGIKPEEMTN